jgi:Flp pilus assembly protein TadG
MTRFPSARSDTGSLSLELVVLAPAILAIFALVIAGGRAVVASQAVAQAASQAARDASLQSSPSAGVAAARSRAVSVLEGQGLVCTPHTISTNATALAKPAGQSGMVTVNVACTVSWSDLGLPTTQSRTLTATGTAPIDTWTER